MTGNLRNPTQLSNDFYETNSELVKLLLKIYNKYHKTGWISIDPSVGRGVIYKKLHRPKRGYDISKKFLNKSNTYEVMDFLKSNPKTNPATTIVVGNPPFRSKTRRQLYMDFVNHASNFANTVIFIVPMCGMKYKNVTRSTRLSLVNVYIPPKAVQFFENDKGSIKHVNVCIQVYQKSEQPSFKNMSKSIKGEPEFTGTHLIYKYPKGHFDFYVRRLDTPKNIGKVVTKYPYTAAYIKEHPNTTGWFGIRVRDRSKRAYVMKRFVEIYEKGDIYKHISQFNIGNWSDLNFYDVIKLFYAQVEHPNFTTQNI